VFIWTGHMSFSWARRIHSTPSHPIPLKYILILFLNLYLGLPIDLLSDFHTKFLYTVKFSTNRSPVKILVMTENCEPPHCEIFSVPLKSKFLPLHPIFKLPLPMLFSEYERLFSYLHNTARTIIILNILVNTLLSNPPIVYFTNICCLNIMPRPIEWNLASNYL
jgi:hypothetical protein